LERSGSPANLGEVGAKNDPIQLTLALELLIFLVDEATKILGQILGLCGFSIRHLGKLEQYQILPRVLVE
jgi:hypothetical protein